jgi:hypothetical protein
VQVVQRQRVAVVRESFEVGGFNLKNDTFADVKENVDANKNSDETKQAILPEDI